MPETTTLSESALALLRRLADGEDITGELETHQELARAGILVELSAFPKGSSFRFTPDGWRFRDEWLSGRGPLRSAS